MRIEGNLNDGDGVLERIYGKEGEIIMLAGRNYVVASFVIDTDMNYKAEILLTQVEPATVPADQVGEME